MRGQVLPAPVGEAEGIGETISSRRLEDRIDARGGASVPNGVREAVVRFERPSDGDPATPEDGDAGDILAMLTDVPDGASVEVCLAGRFDGASFTCCDSLTVRNRGLRGLPRGLVPPPAPGGS